MAIARFFGLLVATASLVACAVRPHFLEPEHWIGRTERELVASWGDPDRRAPTPEGGMRLVFESTLQADGTSGVIVDVDAGGRIVATRRFSQEGVELDYTGPTIDGPDGPIR